jgi:signal transduction histidine kinase
MTEARMSALLEWRSGTRRWLRAWGWSFLVWTALWAYLVTPTFLFYRERGEPVGWWIIGAYLAEHWVTALLTPVFLTLAWRCPLDREARWRWLPGLLVLLALFAAVDDAACIALRWGLFDLTGVRKIVGMTSSWAELFALYIRTVFTYAEITVVGWAIHYQKEARLREVRASQLEAHLTRARLDVLRMQIHPHFLFNTLNSIAALMHRDLGAAERMIARLSDLLRHSLAGNVAQEVTLKDELELSERYLDIERVRFAERLAVRSDISSEALDALVPSLILQPLVENAVRHGIAFRAAGGCLELLARREGSDLVLSVLDDGPGVDPERTAPERCGVGLASTRGRLAELYGEEGRLSIGRRPEGGTEVTVRIPFRRGTAPPAAGADVVLAPCALGGTAASSETY